MDNRKDKQTATPLNVLCAQEAQKICEELDYDLRDTADYCHNNNGHRTFEDWEKMDKYLLGVADRIRRLGKLVGVLSCYAKGGKACNGAKMREALEWCRDFMRDIYDGKEGVKFSAYDIERIDAALAEPPRNCDLYEKEDDAFRAHRYALEDYPEETSIYYEEWLFHKAKGETK